MSSNPKVFISHATEDKERFVKNFAIKLRGKGVDVWYDEWEIRIGDSLVDKIYEQGIKNCEIFIIILSTTSISKKWVKEELDAATIKRIEGNAKLFPLIIEAGVEVPMSLKHLKWHEIKDIKNYKEDLKTIVENIFDMSPKPPLGNKPKYSYFNLNIHGLEKTDSILLKVIGDYFVTKEDAYTALTITELEKLVVEYSFSKELINSSIGFLDEQGYLNNTTMGYHKEPIHIRITYSGMVKYCEYFFDDFDEIVKRVCSCIINENILNSDRISKSIGTYSRIVSSILEEWESYGYMNVSKISGGLRMIGKISDSGRRAISKLLQ